MMVEMATGIDAMVMATGIVACVVHALFAS